MAARPLRAPLRPQTDSRTPVLVLARAGQGHPSSLPSSLRRKSRSVCGTRITTEFASPDRAVSESAIADSRDVTYAPIPAARTTAPAPTFDLQATRLRSE